MLFAIVCLKIERLTISTHGRGVCGSFYANSQSWSQPMPLLGTTKWKTWEVKLDNGEDIEIAYVLAQDVQHAAWQALELSKHRNCKLKDVRLTDEW